VSITFARDFFLGTFRVRNDFGMEVEVVCGEAGSVCRERVRTGFFSPFPAMLIVEPRAPH
jgi:hypothetical protein